MSSDTESPSSFPLKSFPRQASNVFSPPTRRETAQSISAGSIEDQHAIHGYPRLARFMGRFPGYAIFRRFASLNARMLLYFHAEIVELEHELDDLERLNEEDLKLHYVVKELRNAPIGSNGKKQWDKVVELRGKLDQYNKMLLKHERLYKLPAPGDQDVEELYDYLHSEETGGSWLLTPEDTPWALDSNRKRKNKDLVSLNVRHKSNDLFTSWISQSLVSFFHRLSGRYRRKRDEEFGLILYDDEVVDRFSANVTLVLSSLLPTGSIVILYFITSPLLRLIFILLWSGVFTICLALFTPADRIQIFTASVAMASVQVVFIGTSHN